MKYGTRGRVAAESDPALPAEEHELAERRRDDPPPRPPVAEAPTELRNVLEVLAVEADDERREQQKRGDHGESLHHLVLCVRDLRLVVVAGAGDELARDVERLRGAQELVVDVGEQKLGRAW